MNALDRARTLLRKANIDFGQMTLNLNYPVPEDEPFGFHAHQAIEKALKAYITILGIRYPRTHDLGVLLKILQEQGQPVDNYWEYAELNPFAAEWRYDDDDFPDTPLDRPALYSKVQSLLSLVQKNLDSAIS